MKKKTRRFSDFARFSLSFQNTTRAGKINATKNSGLFNRLTLPTTTTTPMQRPVLINAENPARTEAAASTGEGECLLSFSNIKKVFATARAVEGLVICGKSENVFVGSSSAKRIIKLDIIKLSQYQPNVDTASNVGVTVLKQKVWFFHLLWFLWLRKVIKSFPHDFGRIRDRRRWNSCVCQMSSWVFSRDRVYFSSPGDDSSVRVHKCDACGKLFKKLSHLNQHLRTHTGKRCSTPLIKFAVPLE